MRQKYSISREGIKDKLTIKEYAIILRANSGVAASTLKKETFSFLYEETYDGSVIIASIQRGIKALVVTLRTRNFFPIGLHATQIAESVMAIYESEGDRCVELFLDDADLFENTSKPNR